MTVDDIEAVLYELNETLKPMIKRKGELEQKLRKAKSLKWILDNNVTINDVESSSDKNKPWFGNVNTFGKWLSVNSGKKYCEWNGLIYETKKFINGFIDRDAVGNVQDLPS